MKALLGTTENGQGDWTGPEDKEIEGQKSDSLDGLGHMVATLGAVALEPNVCHLLWSDRGTESSLQPGFPTSTKWTC